MKLSAKAFLSAFAITIIGIASAVILRLLILNPGMRDIEASADCRDIERVQIGFDLVRERLSVSVYDVGIHNDLYAFMREPAQSSHYIDNNFSLESFLSIEMDLYWPPIARNNCCFTAKQT